MNLNLNGNCQKTFFFALAFIIISFFALVMPRSNEQADIPLMTAAHTLTSENGILKIRQGETIRIIGAKEILPKVHEKGDREKKLMLSVENSYGERDFVPADEIITADELEAIMPELKNHSFSNSYGFFNRKTLTSKEFDAIPLGATVEEVEKVLYKEEKIETLDDVLTGKYDKTDLFIKKTGRFYVPVMKFKDGRLSEYELKEYYKTHQNAWLLRILPGTEWIYSHNIFNSLSQKKCFGKSKYNSSNNIKVEADKNVWSAILAYTVIILFGLLLFAFYLFIPAIPAFLLYGVFVFPGVVKIFNNLTVAVLIGLVLLAGEYYALVAFMPYVAWWILVPVFIMLDIWYFDNVFNDSMCSKCGFMNVTHLDHEEFLREYDRKGKIERAHKTGESKNVTRTGTEVKTVEQGSGRVLSSHEENVKYHTHTTTDWRNDMYDVTYHVREYKQYFKCANCGLITTSIREECEEIDRKYTGSYNSTSENTETTNYKPNI